MTSVLATLRTAARAAPLSAAATTRHGHGARPVGLAAGRLTRRFAAVKAAAAEGSPAREVVHKAGQEGCGKVAQPNHGARGMIRLSRRTRPTSFWLSPWGATEATPAFGRFGSLLRTFEDEVNAMTRGFDWGEDSQAVATVGSNLEVDVRDEEKEIAFTADVPGLTKDDVKVQLAPGGVLKISGERVVQRSSEEGGEGDSGGARRFERRFSGAFTRAFKLPENADGEHISAKVENGVLDIRVPKVERPEDKLTDIPIN